MNLFKAVGIIVFLSFLCSISLAKPTDFLDYTDYPDYYEVVEWIHSFALEHPELCVEESLGFSTRDSLAIWGLKISANPSVNEDERKVFINGSIHAEEVIGTIICQFLAESLVVSYGHNETITRWLDNMEIWLVPIVNPEGYQVVLEGLDYTYRKNKRDNNIDGLFSFVYYHGNDTDGVDLNRNFTYNWDGIDAVTEMWSSFYGGPSAGSESETQAMMRLCERERFMTSVWYHSSATGLLNEKVFYSWGWSECPDFDRNSRIGLMMSNQMMAYRGAAYISGPIDKQYGCTMDYEYSNFATVSLVVEVDTTTQPPPEIWDYQLRNQWDGLEWLFDRTMEEAIIVHVYACGVDTPIVAQVEIEGTVLDDFPPRLTDPIYGSMYRIMNSGDYNLIVTYMGLSDTIAITVESGEPLYIDVCLEIESVSEQKPIASELSLSASPNPFNGFCEFALSAEEIISEITIVDVQGKLIDKLNTDVSQILWNPQENVPSGVYTAYIKTSIGKVETCRTLYIK